MRAVQEGTVPGKVVIYPQIEGLPLTHLTELAERLPEVAAHLNPAGNWTNQAERELLRHFLAE